MRTVARSLISTGKTSRLTLQTDGCFGIVSLLTAIPRLLITGTAEELDRNFALQISNFRATLERLKSNLGEIESAHAAALSGALRLLPGGLSGYRRP